jgi:hypothetical protein
MRADFVTLREQIAKTVYDTPGLVHAWRWDDDNGYAERKRAKYLRVADGLIASGLVLSEDPCAWVTVIDGYPSTLITDREMAEAMDMNHRAGPSHTVVAPVYFKSAT